MQTVGLTIFVAVSARSIRLSYPSDYYCSGLLRDYCLPHAVSYSDWPKTHI